MDLHDTVRRVGKEVDRLLDLLGSAEEGLAQCLARLQGEGTGEKGEGGWVPARADGDPWVAYT